MGGGGSASVSSLISTLALSEIRNQKCAASTRVGRRALLSIFAINGLMQGGLATALLEFLARSAWARIVPSNLRHCAAEGRLLPSGSS